MAVQAGATTLEKWRGGKGVLLGGVPGYAPRPRGDPRRRRGGPQRRAHRRGHGRAGDRARRERQTMDYLEDIFGGAIETLYSNPANIERSCSAPTWSSARCS
jgi:alanine dehydrogenase